MLAITLTLNKIEYLCSPNESAEAGLSVYGRAPPHGKTPKYK